MLHSTKASAWSRAWFATGLAVLIGVAVTVQAGCQAPSQATRTPPPAFDVASVRLSPPDHGFFSISPDGSDTYTARNTPLAYLIAVAFGVDSTKISGGPGWLNSQLYDIVAKAEGNGGLTREQLQPRLQQLLEQRFHLTTHHEKRDIPGYALVVAKGGPKLQANKGAPQDGYIYPDRLLAHDVSMQSLASTLAYPAGRPVVDYTGIKGMYDFDLHYAPMEANDSSLPSLFTALEEQFGLRLQSQKVPVEMLVIDHVDRTPTEN
jgi:uncharacterized protein (TIGR03435 family)